MRLKSTFLFIMLVGLGLSSIAFTQPTSAPGNGFLDKKEKLQSLIQDRLVQGLGLSPEQAFKFTEVIKKYHQKRHQLRGQMRTYHQQLESISNTSDASQASQLVNNIQKTRGELQKLEEDQFKELKPMLNPQQQAKYFLIMEQIRREMIQIKREMLAPKANF